MLRRKTTHALAVATLLATVVACGSQTGGSTPYRLGIANQTGEKRIVSLWDASTKRTIASGQIDGSGSGLLFTGQNPPAEGWEIRIGDGTCANVASIPATNVDTEVVIVRPDGILAYGTEESINWNGLALLKPGPCDLPT